MQTDRTMALKLNRHAGYPTREALIEFGKSRCMVRQPEKVIDRIGEAMLESLSENRSRVDEDFFAQMQAEWDGGLTSISASRVYVSRKD
jgi:serine/threonine-protein kinase HipA